MKEITELCQRLVLGDIKLQDFRNKMSHILMYASEQDCRDLGRAVLLRPHEYTRKD